MKIGLIGRGAIAQYVATEIEARGHTISTYLLRAERVSQLKAQGCPLHLVSVISDLPCDLDLVVDCAGHQALYQYGAELLKAGFDLVTVSLGALADPILQNDLTEAAKAGGSKLILASGAIGALDALRSANVGELQSLRYIGRKPPKGWSGSPAEEKVDLASLKDEAFTQFVGTAREAAITYPKNANVAAAVALAGLGFDKTQAELIADPTVSANIHEVHAVGSFGELKFVISGKPLPDNPKTSALAAMSVVASILQHANPIRF